MNSQRERQVTSIFHSAIEREGIARRAFLDGACGGDPDLRREVESLIESHEGAGSFIERPAYERSGELIGDLIGDDPQTNLAGRTLGRYRIVSLLGAGGMGEVYLAEDTQLGRSLAIKVLARSLTEDSAIVTRFRQEARAASALNHPNIVTVYEVGESDGTHFIATEFVEGVTLRELMSRTTLEVSKAIDIVAQVASALVKAHSAGVVHRDIKPENVMVDAEGHAKVLDFGIAKLTEQARGGAMEAATVLKVETSPGAVMGTAHYMSPEQARAAGVDSRTDIFSLGVVLYEMLSGRQPFEGATASDVMSAILNKEPPPLARYNREVTEALDLVVQKALAKDRDERYQTAKEMQADLRRVRQRMETGATSDFAEPTGAGADETLTRSLKAADTDEKSGAAPTDQAAQIHTTSSAEYIVTEIKRHKRGVLVALALVVIAAVLFAAYRYAFQPKPAVARFERVKMTRITTEGNLQSVSVSPDGKYIAYALLDAGKRSLWTKHLATDSRVQIVVPSEATDMRPYFFSADGGYVFYGQQDEQYPVGALFQVAVLGGAPRKIMTDFSSPVGLSPDGKMLAFERYRPGSPSDQAQVWLANADGSNERRLRAFTEPEEWLSTKGVSWSPDGKFLTVAYGSQEGGDHETVATIAVADGAFRVITSQRWVEVGRIAWFGDGSGMAVTAKEAPSGDYQIWQVSYPGGAVRRITNDLHNYGFSSLTLTADSRALVALQREETSSIWVAPEGDARRARAIISRQNAYDGRNGLDWLPDGRLVFVSNVGGGRRIWVMNADGSDQKPLTELGQHVTSPRVSPDGRHIFYLRHSKHMQLWRMEIDGTRQEQLTDAGSGVEAFSLTPDGRWVVYDVYMPGIWKVPTDGGTATKISDIPSWTAEVSPDGKLLALNGFVGQTTQSRVTVLKFDDLAPFKSLDLPVSAIGWRWSPDSRAIVYVGTPGGVANLWWLPFDGSAAKQITDFNSDLIGFFAYSRDGRTLALSRGNVTQNALMISDEQK